MHTITYAKITINGIRMYRMLFNYRHAISAYQGLSRVRQRCECREAERAHSGFANIVESAAPVLLSEVNEISLAETMPQLPLPVTLVTVSG